MDCLTNKRYNTYDYTCRYTGIPFYYNKLDDKDVYGLGSNMHKNTEYVTHKIKPTDTLDYLALKYYNNPSYWWIIAYFNDIQDAFVELYNKYTTLRIPNFSSIKFGNVRI